MSERPSPARVLVWSTLEPLGPGSAEGRMTAMAACRTCGTEPLENARLCHGCGSPVEDGDTRAVAVVQRYGGTWTSSPGMASWPCSVRQWRWRPRTARVPDGLGHSERDRRFGRADRPARWHRPPAQDRAELRAGHRRADRQHRNGLHRHRGAGGDGPADGIRCSPRAG